MVNILPNMEPRAVQFRSGETMATVAMGALLILEIFCPVPSI